MCGILGLASKKDLNSKDIKKNIAKLFVLSESRGKESSGIAIKNKNGISIFKKPIPASKLIKSNEYKSFLKKNIRAIIGHSRLVTDGSEYDNNNNQPVTKNGVVIVHNGIITNVDDLWAKYPNFKRKYEIDTEILLELLKSDEIIKAVKKTFKEIEGSASIAVLIEDLNKLLLATNTGSLYYCIKKNILYFASEKYIMSQFAGKKYKIKQIKAFKGKLIDLNNLSITDIDLEKSSIIPKKWKYKLIEYDINTSDKLRKCTKCILPETFPFIKFDKKGVCNYCNNYKKSIIKGKGKLEKVLKKYRNKDGKPDCIVTLSGGRDSCYGLHYIKKIMKMNPIAFTYDWAMVTDLARRNQARICGKLGIEHIIVSADIRKKRDNIRKNIIAWFKKPNLGIIPLLMAGDKQVYHYVKKIEKQTGIKLKIWMDNKLEETNFKTGFSNIEPLFEKKQIDNLLPWQKIRLALYYFKNFLINPKYLNSSMFDSLWAYHSQFLKPRKNICSLFEYIKWDEKEITETLMKEYNWEKAKDTVSSWRIGDETVPLYNYVYYIMAGFTENDTFRSNQIREGTLTRKKALELIREENKPRPDSINLYFKKAGLNINFKDLQKKLKPYQLK